MNVFISWSGRSSERLARHFRRWLPLVLQSIKPFVSSEDIKKGQNWNLRLDTELSKALFGLIIVTRENVASEWLHFEAGALSRSLPSSAVCPILIDVGINELKGPLAQFQCATLSKDDIGRLLSSINDTNPSNKLSEANLSGSSGFLVAGRAGMVGSRDARPRAIPPDFRP